MNAREWRGVSIFALIVATVALFLAWLTANPVQQAADHGVAPVAKALSIIPGVCPDGFKDASDRDEHGRVKACFSGKDVKQPQPGDWIVSLTDDGFFQYAIQVDSPGSEIVYRDAQGFYVERNGERVREGIAVPGWPR